MKFLNNASNFAYHRVIVGYHGCDRETARKVLLEGEDLKPSKNPYDWLGEGIYFWEHGPERAFDFAEEQKKRGKIEEPFILGAYIHLGRCFDLFDLSATQRLSSYFDIWKNSYEESGQTIPLNKKAKPNDSDLLLRFRDCAVLNSFLTITDELEAGSDKIHYQTVRGSFVEGKPVYEGAMIYTKTHIQISVRDHQCILGYFRPVL